MLTQQEADNLLGMKKKFINRIKLTLNEPFDFSVNLISENMKEKFKLDLRQGCLYLKRIHYQKRYEEIIPLIRFDSRGVHENPPELGGNIITGAHLHMYKEGFLDKFAIPADDFEDPENVIKCLKKTH